MYFAWAIKRAAGYAFAVQNIILILPYRTTRKEAAYGRRVCTGTMRYARSIKRVNGAQNMWDRCRVLSELLGCRAPHVEDAEPPMLKMLPGNMYIQHPVLVQFGVVQMRETTRRNSIPTSGHLSSAVTRQYQRRKHCCHSGIPITINYTSLCEQPSFLTQPFL